MTSPETMDHLAPSGFELNADQLGFFQLNGYLIIPDFVGSEGCKRMKKRADDWVRKLEPEKKRAIFTTTDQSAQANEYFLESGDKVRIFMEPDQVHVNKLGHALHILDPLFKSWSLQPALAKIASQTGLMQPAAVQSMYIFKAAGQGGAVDIHQDASFLMTDPPGVLACWLAVEDATTSNGCLWAMPGGHRGQLSGKFMRDGNGGCVMQPLNETQWNETDFLPLEAKAGTLVLMDGFLPHFSHPNRSEKTREAFTLHLVNGKSRWLPENWLQHQTADPFVDLLPKA